MPNFFLFPSLFSLHVPPFAAFTFSSSLSPRPLTALKPGPSVFTFAGADPGRSGRAERAWGKMVAIPGRAEHNREWGRDGAGLAGPFWPEEESDTGNEGRRRRTEKAEAEEAEEAEEKGLNVWWR